MQSTGQTTRQASQPVHMSSSRRARVLGSFFLAMGRVILGVEVRGRKRESQACLRALGDRMAFSLGHTLSLLHDGYSLEAPTLTFPRSSRGGNKRGLYILY